MYIPAQFKVSSDAHILELIERHPFAALVTTELERPRISHLPIVAQRRGDGLWLIGHVARANPHAESILAEAAATAIFAGPHAYVSASWYEQAYATVPTWNYTAVHVSGFLREYDPWEAVKLLSDRMEHGRIDAWDPDGIETPLRESFLRGIVAFELRAETVEAKAKLSQNRTAADQLRVIERLAASTDQTDRECAAAMAEANLPKG